MNPKFVSVLVVDQNPDSGRAMAQLLKSIFHRVYHQADLGLVPGEIQDLKPKALFVNLTLAQRTQNLELAEILGKSERPPLFLGYSDAHEPELLAHALENGFQDLFLRPFDEDMIASKVNKFFQDEKAMGHDIAYSAVKPPLRGSVRFSVRLTGCDENGTSFECDHYLSKGTVITLPEGLSRELTGETGTEFLITKTWTSDNWEKFFFYAELRSPTESRSASLRKFILSKTT